MYFPVGILAGVSVWVGMGIGAIMMALALSSNKENPVSRIAVAVAGFALFSLAFNGCLRHLVY